MAKDKIKPSQEEIKRVMGSFGRRSHPRKKQLRDKKGKFI